ncbi:MAG: ABC transporter permease [Chlamydiales bacterium]|nr:ABC transporter permease [Chlamydiales bacterium]
MVLLSTVFATLIGIPLGILLTLTGKGGLKELPWFYHFLSFVVNVGRSVPFAILIIAIFPFTRLIVGTSVGTTASIVPLTITAAPFLARVIEGALLEVNCALIEAAQVMKASIRKIVWRVLIPEALPSIVQAITQMTVTLIGYSAMAGLVGGGGLGKVAIQYGYQRFDGFLMFITLVLLLLLVWVVQGIGNGITYSIRRKRGLA